MYWFGVGACQGTAQYIGNLLGGLWQFLLVARPCQRHNQPNQALERTGHTTGFFPCRCQWRVARRSPPALD
jgi:hypothetical protein